MSYESQSGKLNLSKNYFMFKVMDTLFFNLADFWTIHETLIKIWYALHESWNLIILCNLISFTFFFFFFFIMVGNKYWLFWNNLVPCPWNTSILQLVSRLRSASDRSGKCRQSRHSKGETFVLKDHTTCKQSLSIIIISAYSANLASYGQTFHFLTRTQNDHK